MTIDKVGRMIFVDNFNSHAHVERDRLKVATLQLMKGISTHTLTWSVTFNKRYSTLSNHISTHTLTWSVTLSECLNAGEEVISTHTLTWSVTLSGLVEDFKRIISTHTLTWSVTTSFGTELTLK